ncbi:hypothetical protein GSU69_19725 (plasmid) [Rathayibacter festucae]|uniref:Uncharacterized protein n=1 Tax=Rathayibacter festucae TaxID=110937 RepID=A0ABX6H5K7_9MICO|nr:hypothetical protein [Rathayibacter festucae]QHC65085.1 hypothetical protein GSU69_19725 [Rathayibacter festucae]
MSIERSARPSASAPLVLGLLLGALAIVLVILSGLHAWDPDEACYARGSSPSPEKFFGTAMCADGTAVQPMWMTVSAGLLLITSAICITIAIIRRARRDDEKGPLPTVSHWS